MGHLPTTDGLKVDPESVQAVIEIPKSADIRLVTTWLASYLV